MGRIARPGMTTTRDNGIVLGRRWCGRISRLPMTFGVRLVAAFVEFGFLFRCHLAVLAGNLDQFRPASHHFERQC